MSLKVVNTPSWQDKVKIISMTKWQKSAVNFIIIRNNLITGNRLLFHYREVFSSKVHVHLSARALYNYRSTKYTSIALPCIFPVIISEIFSSQHFEHVDLSAGVCTYRTIKYYWTINSQTLLQSFRIYAILYQWQYFHSHNLVS